MESQKTFSQGALIHKLESILDPLDFAKMFPETQPVEVELGAGDGSFIVQYANLQRGTNFLAVERLLGRLRKIDKRGQRAGLTNLVGVRIEAAYLLQYLLAAKSVAALHVYFPDPWPKRKHRKNRLVNEEFTELVRKVLVDRGIIHLRTDDTDYFSQMTRVFDGNSAFEKINTPEELKAVKTDFERYFNAQGIPTNWASYKLR